MERVAGSGHEVERDGVGMEVAQALWGQGLERGCEFAFGVDDERGAQALARCAGHGGDDGEDGRGGFARAGLAEDEGVAGERGAGDVALGG